MGAGLFPSKWMVEALVKIWKLENALEEWHLGDCRVCDKE